ncbi:MAG: insulinase family protein, partial [Nostoc sp.]
TFGKLSQRAKKNTVVNNARRAIDSSSASSSIADASPSTPAAKKAPIVLKQPGSTALLQAVYPLPDIKHPDVPAIDLMDAILTGGRSSRLY